MTWEEFISYDHLYSLGIAIGIFLLFLVFRKLFTKFIFAGLKRFANKTNSTLFSNVLLAFEKPVQWVFIILGIYAAVYYYPELNHEQAVFVKVLKIWMILLVSWGLFKLASTSSAIIRNINEKTRIEIDEILIPLLSRALQVVVVAISVTIVLNELGYAIDGLVAGMGLGGLAISLAARDALANMFGGIVIITEKPFGIGDWILTPSVEGTVEDITFRSTRVRTFADAVVTVPNATLANESITNWSKMGKRRITFNIRLTFDTPSKKLDRVVGEIRKLIEQHPEVHPETIFVNVDFYKEDGIDILLYFFTKTTDWGQWLGIKEDINLKILQILEREGVSFAVPSRRIYVDSEKEQIDLGNQES
ncbi:mechanosensitive ion channel family protein [Ornithinibacillus halophilus]|uniref:MscS family membrane protein n=1 Tax=Ornithinibacillus halophilus TaxID=930117 RepID=A0A1M5DXI9_9BACI|nr:mechanosensitive ion channel family protein [Ornithinibacillus halophilus]SHF71703.1 MscS family membrane protein [Ornithinibacillus halophilus]